MTNPNEPAHPAISSMDNGDGTFSAGHFPGLTKREAFAMAAMQGLLSSDASIRSIASAEDHQEAIADLAHMAVTCAEKTMAELARGSKE